MKKKTASNTRLTLRRAVDILLMDIDKQLTAQHRRYSAGASKGWVTRRLRARAKQKIGKLNLNRFVTSMKRTSK